MKDKLQYLGVTIIIALILFGSIKFGYGLREEMYQSHLDKLIQHKMDSLQIEVLKGQIAQQKLQADNDNVWQMYSEEADKRH